MTAFWIKFGSGWTLWAGILLFLLGAAGAFWGYRETLRPDGGRTGKALLLVRLAALLLFALILLHPVLALEEKTGGKPVLAILLDDSRSMAVRDSLAGLSRAAAARRILFSGGEDSLAGRLSRDWDLSFRLFSGPPISVSRKRAASTGEIARGGRSLIREAIFQTARDDPAGRLGAILVFTDGRETGSGSGPLPARVPVHLVGLGGSGESSSFRDLALRSVQVGERALLANRMEGLLEVSSKGMGTVSTTLVLERDGKKVLEKKVSVPPGESTLKFAFIPKVAGNHAYQVSLAPVPGEVQADNNRRAFVLSVDPRKLRILYYEPMPRWKYKFLRRALLRDRNLSVTFQLRTNPARILQQGSAPTPLRSGFPADMKELGVFDCVILGDLSRADLAEQQWRLLVTYVNRLGGGLLFLGGPVSLSPGGIGATPLAEILPCAGGAGQLKGRLLVQVTREGRGHPILSGLEKVLQGGRAALFPLSNIFRLTGLKPGAQVLAAARGPRGGSFPLLVVQRVGAGRTMVFASDSDWRWVMERRREGGGLLFDHLWSQAVRWLAGKEAVFRSGGSSLALVVDRPVVTAGEKVRIRITGSDILSAEATLEGPGGARALPLEKRGGELLASLAPPLPGSYRVSARVERKGKKGRVKKELAARFLVEPDERETADTSLDRSFLERIAQATGGKVFDAASAGRIPGVLRKKLLEKRKVREYHPRSTPFVFLAVILLLGVEWWVRRRRYGI